METQLKKKQNDQEVVTLQAPTYFYILHGNNFCKTGKYVSFHSDAIQIKYESQHMLCMHDATVYFN